MTDVGTLSGSGPGFARVLEAIPGLEERKGMRRLKRCVAVVVGIAGAAIVLGCGSKQPTPPLGLNEVQLTGWQAYIDLNCGGCHGENREGQRSGPALAGLAQHWSAEQLVSYLTDPNAMVKASPRLRRISEGYAIGMPAASAKAPGYATKARSEKLSALAEYLLVDMPQTAHE